MINTPGILNKTARRDGSDPFNEALSFSRAEYDALKVARPDLFDPGLSPQDKAKLWKEFAQSSIGKHFRWR